MVEADADNTNAGGQSKTGCTDLNRGNGKERENYTTKVWLCKKKEEKKREKKIQQQEKNSDV